MSRHTRGIDFVDLLSDSEDERPRKRLAPASSFHTRPGSSSRAAQNALPASTRAQPQVQATPPEPEFLDLTQDEPVERELYGSYAGKIVGVRYYNGYATPGEAVLCRREPQNRYDRNAIRVDNVLSQQIGHIPRKVAELLSPMIMIEWELKTYKLVKPGEITRLKKEAEKRKKEIEARRAAAMGMTGRDGKAKSQVPDSTQHQPFGVMNDAPEISMEDILQTSEAVELRKGGDVVKTLAIGEDQLAEMPLAKQPDQLKATLLPYQLQGLAWMKSKENPQFPDNNPDAVIQLWKRDGQGRYRNLASNFICLTAPKLFSGGILADDMGLGKTIQIISLILTGGPGTTLIVAPVGVMSNWEQQIRRHVKEECQPKILIYHGSNRSRREELFDYDVVITSYGTLNSDGVFKSPPSPWRRIVLDEGHTIRNARTKVAQAACQIDATSRWVLTGTPIINSVRDLQSLLKFLHITGGIEQPDVFNQAITRHLASGDRSGEALLQALMQDICLRRKKDMKFVDLKIPKKTEYIHRITFHPDEKTKYDALLSEARGMLKSFQDRSQHGQHFQSVLENLLRLRQTCNHWTLCKERIDDLMKLLEDQAVVPLTEKNRALLQEALRLFIETQDDCAICFDPPTGPVITNCKHVFCRACITKAIGLQQKCPMCRNPLTEDMLLEPAPEGAADNRIVDSNTQSSKTEAMVHIIQATLKRQGSKLVIFSQWTSFLDIVQKRLEAIGLKYCRIDGSMNASKRDLAVDALDNDPDTQVMLASLAVCSVGLNLVSADTVILSDSWWAPAIEDQAVDRVHRLGQTRETTIWRMVMDGSIEDRVLEIQKDKRELVTKAFQEKGKGKKSTETRMADVVKLLS